MELRRVEAAEVSALAAELVVLQRQAYAIEAALIGDERIPPLHESEADLLAAGLTWLLAIDGVVVGGLGFTEAAGSVDIDRLIVDPKRHRRGIGRALVVAALGPRTMVSTGRANEPARRLYESLGFRHQGDREALGGLWVSDYLRGQV